MASAASTVRRVKPAELARELGVSRQAIADLIRRGVLSQDADGLLDHELARVALANRVRPSSKTAKALTSAPPPADRPAAAAPAGLTLVRTDTGERIPLGSTAVTIGRSSDATIVVEDTRVSRSHATVEPSRSGWSVVDNGSSDDSVAASSSKPTMSAKITVTSSPACVIASSPCR